MPNAARDDAMALQVFAILKEHPDAIIIGSFGFNHITEGVVDGENDKRIVGANLNDRLGEQLALTLGREAVHSVYIRPTSYYLNLDANGEKVYKHDGSIDAVLRVVPHDD